MCQHCHDPNRILLAKDPPGIDRVIQTTIQQFSGVLGNWHDGIVEALGTMGVDLSSSGGVRVGIERVTDEYRDTWVTVIEDAWTEGATAGRGAAIQRHELDISWDLTDPKTIKALKKHGQQAAEQIQSRMVGDLTNAIVEGYQSGLGVDEISQTLRDEVFPDMRGYEARRVARTEVVSSGNRGRQTGFEDASIPFQRWMARDDDDTRDSHNEADGQVVPVNGTFLVGGHKARFPGDPRLPASERINCRCIIIPEMDNPDQSVRVVV